MTAEAPHFVGVTIHADRGSESDVYPGHPLLYVERNTVELLKLLGLVPFLIPVYQDHSLPPLHHLKGLVFTGGGYLDLMAPQSRLSGLGSTGNERYHVEKRLIEYGLAYRVPMVGFCRGAQMINEVLGGTLANIPEGGRDHHQEKRRIPAEVPVHGITVEEGSRLHSITGKERLEVNSFHRQHMAALGMGLKVSAKSIPEGYTEAFESITHPFLYGFQFHPEKLYEHDPVWLKFFNQFAAAVKSFTLTINNPA